MTNISGNSIGVDISKNTLDCYRWETKEYRQFLNTHLGIQELIKWIKKGAPSSMLSSKLLGVTKTL